MKKALIALTILAGALSGAHAGIILSDDFTYNDGPVAQPTAATINPGSSWISNTGTGAGKEIDVTNNTLLVTSSRSEDMFHFLGGYPYLTNGPTTALYSKYTLKCTYLPSSSGTYFSHFSGTNGFGTLSGFRARVWASMTNYSGGTGPNPALGQFSLGILNSGYYTNATTGPLGASSGNTNYVWPTPLVTNVTYTIVTRYILATGFSTLWVNPVNETDPSVTDSHPLPFEYPAIPTNGILSIVGYSFRQAGGEGDQWIDNLKVGTTWNDLFTAPTIGPVPQDQNIPMNGSTPALAFVIASPTNAAISSLTLSTASDNTALVPNDSSHIALTKDNSTGNCTVTVIPATGVQGAATITVSVTQGAEVTSMSFKVLVGAPVISSIPNQTTGMNTAIPAVAFGVGDVEGDAVTLTKASSNPTLVPVGNIVLGVAVANVSSNVVVTPASGQHGIATITISANDGHSTTSTSFKVTVTPAGLGVVYNEDFAYTGFDVANGLLLATGGSGAPWSHVSGNNAYELQVTNVTGTSGFAYIVSTNNEDLGAPLIGGPYDGSQGYVFYTSFTVDCSYLPSAGGDYFFHLAASATDSSSFHDKVFANKANAAVGTFRIGVANTANIPLQFARDLQPNATYAVITRYNSATGDSTLWVNPINEQSPSVTSSDSPGSSTVGGVALRQAGCCTGDLAVGPMKVGTSFSDVWTAPAQPQLHFVTDGLGNLVLSWTGPLFVLQSAPEAAGPYTDVAVASPYAAAISGQQFFRLKY